ncbi:MAG: hypothetical protein K6G52_01975 [Treponemataceae bacterium]|nr:hypothetical protein [Treponemataceae bacterium]
MKINRTKIKNFILPAIIFSILINPTFSQESDADPSPYGEFVAASLHDKVAIVENAQNATQLFYEQALSFVYENKSVIEDYPDYYVLLITTIKKLNHGGTEGIDELLLQIYHDFEDYSVKLAVIEAFSKIDVQNESVYDFVMSLLNEEINKKENISVDVFVACLEALGNIKNSDCTDLIFSLMKEDYAPEIKAACKATLFQLMDDFYTAASNIIDTGTFEDKKMIFELINENPEKNLKSTAEIAEILLSDTIIKVEEDADFPEEQIKLQFDAFVCLKNAKWTKATDVVLDYFEVARNEFEKNLLSEDNYCFVIEGLKEFSTRKTCKVLTDYLASQYNQTLENGEYNLNVLLSVINTLGDLGDNDAFDTILYVMSYKDYPRELIQASNAALKKLRWDFDD